MTARDALLSPRGPAARDLGARDLAGYRVLRSLARDQDAEVLLGHRRVSAALEAPADGDGAVVQTVAIKRSPVSDSAWERALRECAALERARGDHVVDLLDVDADDESMRLIFERLPRGDLVELLSARPRLEAGEAVTVLAPIAATLLRMHTAGVAHGNLSAGTVLFRDDGSPTLIGFSHAALFEPAAPEVVLEQVEAVGRDRAAAGSLAALVLGRVDGARSHAARDLVADLEGCDDETVLPLLASRLFEVAAAVPLRFEPDEPEADTAPSAWRAIPVGAPGESPLMSPAPSPSPAWAAALARLVPEPVVHRVLESVDRSPAAPVVAAVAEAVRRRWTSWTPARRRTALAVAAAGVTVVVVMAVVPAGAAGRAPTHSPPGPSWPAPSSSGTPTSDDDAGVSGPSVSGDDPVAAATSLVSDRDRCLRSLSMRCLDRVDEAGSSALSSDQSAIREVQRGGELPGPLSAATGEGRAVLIERLGDSALVRLGPAASTSLLLVKGDAGWRIRDVIAADARVEVTPTPTPTPSATGG